MSTTASSSTARFTPRLPTEIWTRIIRTATGKRVSAPWNVPLHQSRPPGYLSVKLAIVLVCKRWRALGLCFLYEDIVICERTFDGLLSGLERIEAFEKETNGRYVRRIVFSPTRMDMDIAILKCCPNVEFLVKPPSTKDDDGSVNGAFPFPDRSITSFESVKCIVWSLRSPYGDPPNSRESASFLWHIVQVMPNIRYMSLNGGPHPASMVLSDLHLYLKQLQGLRVEGVNASVRQGMFEWTLPALTYFSADMLVLGQNLMNASQLCFIEILPVAAWYMVSLVSEQTIVHILGSCPRLRELSYEIRHTKPPKFPEGFILQASLLECVQLHAFDARHSPSLFLVHTESHLHSLCGPMFPSLKRVIIHGICMEQIKAQIVNDWEARLRAQSCALEWEIDGWSEDDIYFNF